MRNNFKPLGIAAAVAAVAAGYAQAQPNPTVSNNGFGNLALVPYYTVMGDYGTGVHVINSSDQTQVVKFRLRRGADSMDALDFNLILSPEDVWTGFLQERDDGTITFDSTDTSCVAPTYTNSNPDGGGSFEMPPIYRDGAEEGYIEVIGMGSIAEASPIGYASKHVDGMPRDCAGVRSNFFSIGADYPGTAGTTAAKGVIDFSTTHQAVTDITAAPYNSGKAAGFECISTSGDAGLCVNSFGEASNALKVSYFIRDREAGIEFGGEAVHIADFLGEPAMSNQAGGLSSGDVSGFDYPDLNGGSIDGNSRGVFNALRSSTVLGALAVANDWSANPNNGVSTDWVLTMPGQYTMLDLATYTDGFDTTGVTGAAGCKDQTTTIACDNRDIPVVIKPRILDREEGSFTPDPGGLVISPQPPAEDPEFTLDREVNVIQWNGDSGVLGSADPLKVDNTINPLDARFGWARIAVESTAAVPATCTLTAWSAAASGTNDNLTTVAQDTLDADGDFVSEGAYECASVDGNVPVIGMVAWERRFAADPASSYGRIVEHAYITES